MKRTPVNPWEWSLRFGYSQGEVFEGIAREIVCAGQTAVDSAGAPQHPDDMRGQMRLAMENLEAVLAAANMTPANIKKLSIFTTDVDATLRNFDILGARLSQFGVAPPMTLLGVARLAIPSLMFEIEASAVA